MRTKILVTGASGFVGSFLIRELLKEPNNYITALYCNNLPLYARDKHINRVNWVQSDLTRKNNNFTILDGIQVLYHLVGYSSIKETSSEISKLDLINVSITKRLAEACVNSDVKHFIYVSSIAACECSDYETIDENNGSPQTHYGFSKKRAEDILFKIVDGQFAVTVLRPTALFGEYHQGSIYELTKSIKYNRFVIFGSGKNLTNFYYIRDFIEILINVKDNNKAFNQVFIASDDAFQLGILIEWIVVSLKSRNIILKIPIWIGYLVGYIFDAISYFTKIPFPFSLRRLKAMTKDVVYSNRKIKNTIDVKKIYGVQKGINNTIVWYENNKLL
jgi:dihydroflavonol-4-reductase